MPSLLLSPSACSKPLSPRSHWGPEKPLLHKHLFGSTHTPPLRHDGSHLAETEVVKGDTKSKDMSLI